MTKSLTAKFIENAKPKPARQEIPDGNVPGLYFVIQPSGAKSWAIRYRHAGVPRKLTLGPLAPKIKDFEPEPVLDGPLTLTGARTLARDKLREVANGIDPAGVKRIEKTAARDPDNSFAAAVERWVKAVVIGKDETKPEQRQGHSTAKIARRELVTRWGKRPATSIARADVIAMVREIEGRGKHAMARNTLDVARRFFGWLMQDEDGAVVLPTDRVKLTKKKNIRTRVLRDDELFAYWRMSGRMGYPFGPMYRMLALSGQRREEVSAARWREFHPALVRLLRQRKPDERIDWAKVATDVKVWTVSADRFKSDAPHLVPLSDAMCELLATLPFYAGGDHLFSSMDGSRPVSGFSKAKARLDTMMLRTLRAIARMQGDDPKGVELEPFVVHDVRRTLRTRLSALRIDHDVAEMVIGHAKKELERVYNQHRYAEEMREALTLWAHRLADIVEPKPAPKANVVILRHEVEA